MARKPDPTSRAALVDSARAEFARRGLHSARIEDITAACGLSKGSFYLHFPSKEALFAELVQAFEQGMEDCYQARRKLTEQFFTERPLTRNDIAKGTARYREFRAREEGTDTKALDLMWAFRDVVEVLVSGAQGTPFEGMLWKQVEREAARVADEITAGQKQGICRTDIPPPIFGAMMVGTYLVLGHRLSSLREKPDLRSWARSIQNLVHPASSAPAPLKRKAPVRKISRTSPRSSP